MTRTSSLPLDAPNGAETAETHMVEPVRLVGSLDWSMSPTIGKLAESLAKAQLKFDPVLKDSENPYYKSRYADLATVIEATRKHLASEGISTIQMPHARFNGHDQDATLVLTTLLAHSSGEWVSSDLTLPAMMKERLDSQSVGSAITYARRYALSAMTGVAQEDDDGNRSVGIGSKEAAQEVGRKKAAAKVAEIEKHKAGVEPIEITQYKENTLAIRGNGVALLRLELSADEKSKCRFRYDRESNIWTIPAADGNMLASLCEKYKLECRWSEAQ